MNNRDPSDFPPITVVTAGSNSSSRKLPKNNAPTILLKPPSKQQLAKGGSSSDMTIAPRPIGNSPTGSTAVVDGGNINGTGTANTNPNNSASTSDAMNMTINNDKQVDSALVSALRDKRERMALLRLEKNLVEFMNDKNCGFMEVGGAGNSTVIRGASGGGGGSGSGPNTADAENESGAARVQNTNTATTGVGMNGYNPGNGNDGSGGRQTSFQRLCLHRLADRFNIVREQGYNNPNHYMTNNPGLIRLVKVKESRIPSLKLINLDLTQYDQSVPQDRGEGFSVMGVTDRLASTQLHEAGNGSGSGKKSKKKEKVKIMKRSSSSNLVGNDEKGKLNASKRKGKKLSDKEKAYAEARARIFNDSNESGLNTSAVDGGGGSEHASVSNSNDSLTPPGSRDRSAATSPVVGKNASLLDSNESVILVPSQIASGANANATKDMKQNRGNLPAAATGGAASKVTWRNREQEASDPDFQRRHHPGMVQPMPMHPQQYHLYAQNGMMGNGYGHPVQTNGYHYGVPADGQMYNHGQIYASPNSHYQPDGSWLPYESQGLQHSQQDHRAPTHNASNVQKDIDLSQDEFPALR